MQVGSDDLYEAAIGALYAAGAIRDARHVQKEIRDAADEVAAELVAIMTWCLCYDEVTGND